MDTSHDIDEVIAYPSDTRNVALAELCASKTLQLRRWFDRYECDAWIIYTDLRHQTKLTLTEFGLLNKTHVWIHVS